jgi:predicted SnoaL-like aldol condensation-catalyzing enzyme
MKSQVKEVQEMDRSKQGSNKDLVLKAFDTLFNQRDYSTAEAFWSPRYIQHSAHIEPGKEGLFSLVQDAPATLRYEPGLILAESDWVILHGRFSNLGLPVNWIVTDILRIENGLLAEHWEVIQDEASAEQSRSKALIFDGVLPLSVRRETIKEACLSGASSQVQQFL